MVYFHRGSGVAFVCDASYLPRLKELLRDALGEKFVEAQWMEGHGGVYHIRALGKEHLDLTSVIDDAILAG